MKHKTYFDQLGYHVQRLRKSKKMSQALLAEKIDKSIDTVSNIERGKAPTSINTVIDVANALDVELYELFQVRDMPVKDKNKNKLLDEILSLLKDQPEDILKFSLKQTKELISLKESFIKKLQR
tara:strand:+ start:87 stop:458 length:372 start_codon:yes stop_codon:yes gene_type:complete